MAMAPHHKMDMFGLVVGLNYFVPNERRIEPNPDGRSSVFHQVSPAFALWQLAIDGDEAD